MIISQIRSPTFSIKNRNPLNQLTGYSQVYFSLYTFDFSRLQFHLIIHNNHEDCFSQQAIDLLEQCKQKVEARRGTDTVEYPTVPHRQNPAWTNYYLQLVDNHSPQRHG